ncbi:MAG TPA: phosphatidylglycerol lysyltransferase domain-containing protein [Pirellulaceae bacterium]|nr:phosphatidylglycerol lysyltransferase domain-containing protein [Pirellulaceae bacterium]
MVLAQARQSSSAALRAARGLRRPGKFAGQSPAADSAPATAAERLELVRAHGDFSLAYTTAVQSGLSYFGDNRGYLAHDSRLGHTFVLADPVAAPPDRERLVRQFAAMHRRLAFCQISRATAQIVQELGFYVNEMGVDSIVPLAGYDFRGREKKWLRTAESWTSRRGYTTREDRAQHVGLAQINAVSLAWRATRTVKFKEVRFLNRPLVASDEPGTRRFFFFGPGERLLAFVFFDPLYRDGRLVGYAACSKRRHPEAPVYAEQAIMKHAIEVFQREDCQELRLGLSPLAWIEDREFRASWLLRTLFRGGFSSRLINRRIYNVQGHAEYKRRYRGREEKLYYATRTPLNLLQLAALVKTCKIL